MANQEFWRNKRVFITGHSGFKGAWLALWLTTLGAKVKGLSLPLDLSSNSLFNMVHLSEKIESQFGDIRNFSLIKKAILDFSPQVVFHLAAQALVGPSFDSPIDTYETNILGTAHVLEAVRSSTRPRSVIFWRICDCCRIPMTTPHSSGS